METTERAIILSEEAVTRLKVLLLKDNGTQLALRVFVSAAGPSRGYGMALDDVIQDDDHVFEQQGVRVVIDEMSAPYLAGAQVDYDDRPTDGGFTIHNLGATSP